MQEPEAILLLRQWSGVGKMPVEDRLLDKADRAYRPSQSVDDLVIAERNATIGYKKSYGGISKYFKGIMRGKDSVLRYTICDNKDGHDDTRTIRYQVPRKDCQECYEETDWKDLPKSTRFFIETRSTAVELAGISFIDQLPLTVAWIKAVIPGKYELDTLTAGMVQIDDYESLEKGTELRPVFRKDPKATASDVMWVLKGTKKKDIPEGYVTSKHYKI